MPFLNDGYRTIISLTVDDITVYFREKEVQPPGLEVGSIDTTTMRNGTGSLQVASGGAIGATNLRTKQPKSLATYEDMTVQAQYDPRAYTDIRTKVLGRIGNVLVTFPDGGILIFRGWLDSFKPQNHREGEFPLAEIKIVASLQDATSTNIIQPAYANLAGVSGTA